MGAIDEKRNFAVCCFAPFVVRTRHHLWSDFVNGVLRAGEQATADGNFGKGFIQTVRIELIDPLGRDEVSTPSR